jgi:TonB-linked SusC/RagA family outer membrane protein
MRKTTRFFQRTMVASLMMCFCTLFIQAQRAGIPVSGKVSDAGEPLPGVTVAVRGTTLGTSTDQNGDFTLSVPSDTCVLQISYIGFVTKEIKVGSQRIFVITLEEDNQQLEEVVVVGFGKQKKTDVIGAVTSVNLTDIKKVSSSNMTTMMAGNIAGIISYQRSGEPGNDNADFFIRGVTTFGYKKDPLILIDGIESDRTSLARMQPDDIANFSIMKDATSTAVYGARGANGVVSITTKEGSEGKLRISGRIEEAMTMATRKIELADPITYMKMGNEAVLTRNPLGTTPYLQSKIDNTMTGNNPFVYPVTDWYNELLSDRAYVQRINLNASGGGKVARYYLAATFNQDNGNLKVDKRNNFNNNISLRTYSFRSNINFNLTNTTKASLKMAAVFDDYTGPINGGSDVYWQVMHANPVLFPPYYEPDAANRLTRHILFGNSGVTGANYLNPYAEMIRGYKDYASSKIDAQFEVEQDLSKYVDGLSVRALFQTSRYSYFDVSRYYNPYYYTIDYYDRDKKTYTLQSLNIGTEYLGYNEGAKRVNTSTYIELMSNYQHVFNDAHSVNGMLVYIMRNYMEGNAGDIQLSLPSRNLGLSGRMTYIYRDKYLTEFNFGYNGSERFHESHRFGFFPSFGVGWTISNEDFWTFDKINFLKLRATYGLVGNDAIGDANDRFYYLSKVNMEDGNRGARFGTGALNGGAPNWGTSAATGGYYLSGVSLSRNANNEIGWEISQKANYGIEVGVNDGQFQLEADYFTEYRTNILMPRASIPTTMGLTTTEKANVGEAKAHGVDGSINYTANLTREIWMKARVNYTFATSEFLIYEEPLYKDSYRRHAGHSLSQQWGLIAERLFIDEEEVANSPYQGFSEYGAGDIKYRDVNGDGSITNEDAVSIGYPTDPEIIYGFGVSGGYRNFDISCFFQGSARSSFWIDINGTSPFNDRHSSDANDPASNHPNTINETQLLKAYADSYWSEDHPDLYALWPRLSKSVNSNNAQRSTWFMQNGAFLRLKSLEIGYTLPEKWMQKMYMTNARFYLNGTNLLNFSKFKLWDVEMGGNGLGYPIQKVVSLGLTVAF